MNQMQGFYFSKPLPVPELEQLLRQEKCLPTPDGSAGMPINTLLLVDDDTHTHTVLQSTLRQDDCHILSAASAAEGFELLVLHLCRIER